MKQDVAIIGGGVIGVACAVELARRGAQVTVLERDRVGHGCSYGNAGWLTPSQAVPLANPAMLLKSFKWMLDPESPLYIQPRLDPAFLRWLIEFLLASRKAKFERGAAALVELCRVSVDLWEDVANASPEPFGFERHGLLAVYENAASLEAARSAVDLVCQSGVRAERWTADEVREKEPAIIGPQVGGYFYPDDAHCEPYRRGESTRGGSARARRAVPRRRRGVSHLERRRIPPADDHARRDQRRADRDRDGTLVGGTREDARIAAAGDRREGLLGRAAAEPIRIRSGRSTSSSARSR